MNDFLIHFGPRADAAALADLLRDRPIVCGHPVQTFDFAWGKVAVQPPAARGYAPLRQGDSLVAAVGRPRLVGVEHEQLGEQGFNSLFRERLDAAGARALADALTGMFAVVECGGGRVRVMTDQMGFMPVYAGHDAAGRVVSLGTHLESVAALAGRLTDFDPVSLGDLLVNQYITFPYTTRRGLAQLEPGAVTEFGFGPAGDVRAADVRTTILWRPTEPAGADVPSVAQLEEELEEALRAASADVVRGASRIALTLSGGLDSRLVLAALKRERPGAVAGAITYATRDNREVDVARRVAAAAGVRHHVARRGVDFYAELLPRSVALLGTELRGECHGFCVVDNALEREYDLIVGGFLSDTLFKGHYMAEATRERLRRRSPYRRARLAAASVLRAWGVLPPVRKQIHFWDVARGMETRLAPDVREAVRERRRVRLEQVRRVRPETAEEWVRFWPASRGDGAYGPQANVRLFTCDELFFHRRLVEVAARVPAYEKVAGRLTRRVFPRVYGELGEIENAATGVPAALAKPSRRRNGRAGADGRWNGRPVPLPGSSDPWNDVEDSWVNWELLQKLSPTWSSYRAALADSPAMEVLGGVLAGGAREFVGAYRDEAGFLFNRAVVQLAYAVDRTLRGPAAPRAPSAGAAQPAAGRSLVTT